MRALAALAPPRALLTSTHNQEKEKNDRTEYIDQKTEARTIRVVAGDGDM